MKKRTLLALLLCLCMTLGLCGTAFASEPALAVPDTPEPGMVFVHASVPDNWKNPSAWAWSSDRNAFDAWPGEPMERDGDWYTVQVPDWADHFIVNANEGSVQTEDLDIQPGKEVWITVNASGSTYSADISYEDPSPATAEAAPAAGASGDVADATIIVYMVGSDLESDNGMASSDIVEMAYSGFDFENKNLLVVAGGAEEWHLTPELPEDSLCLLEIREEDYYLIDSIPAVSMADPSTLSMCLNFCYENYPAESYGLILWNHGGGPIVGYGIDDLFANEGFTYWDMLTMRELAQALDDSPFGNGNKLSFLGFDACMMCSVEVAWMLQDYAEYMIASEEIIPGYGWDYSFLGALAAGPLDGYNAGYCAVEAYENYYLSNPSPWNATISLSCLNLSYADQLEKDVEALFSKASADLAEGAYSSLAQLRYDVAPFPAKYTKAECDMVDLGDLAEIFYAAYPEETEAIYNTINQMNECSWLASDRATGMTIYFPMEHQEEYLKGSPPTDNIPFKDVYKDLGFAPKYVAFLEDFSEQWSNSSKAFKDVKNLPVVQETEEAETAYYFQLTEEQAADVMTGGYYLLVDMGFSETEQQEGYMLISGYGGGYVDSQNRLQVSVSDSFPVLMNQDGELVIPALYVDEVTNAYYLFAYLSNQEDLFAEDSDAILVVIPVVAEEILTPVPLEYAVPFEEDDTIIGKTEFPISEYTYISFVNPIVCPAFDEQGALLPAGEWNVQAESLQTVTTYRTDSYFEMTIISLALLSEEMESPFSVQLFGVSAYGEVFASDLIPYTGELHTWGVVGNICGTSWDADFSMLEIRRGMFCSEPLQLNAGEEFKVRLDGSWDLNFGADGDSFVYEDEAGNTCLVFNTARDGANCVAEESGTYYVLFDSNQNLIYLIPA